MFDPKTASALGELQDRANCLKDVPAALAGMTIITLSDELILRRRSASFLHFQDIWPTLLLVGNGVGRELAMELAVELMVMELVEEKYCDARSSKNCTVHSQWYY